MNIEITTILDARGLNSPLPILKTRKTLNLLESGDILQLISSDPGSVKDIDTFCQQDGNELVQNSAESVELNFIIRKN